MRAPHVSIIVPCYNERETIGILLEAIAGQEYPLQDMEVVIADGRSTDGTLKVIDAFAFSHRELDIRVVDNPDRSIPAGLNRALQAARGEIILRLDAHSKPDADYVSRTLEVLRRTEAANVGGRWRIKPSADTAIARGIARAVAHPIGAGGARYRTNGEAGPVETVPFGAFPRTWIERVGYFNEDLLSNEDYEYNVRLRQAGGLVWFDPTIRTDYYARPTLGALARQYFRYGFWKARMLLRYPTSIHWRQVLPALFTLTTFILLFASLFWTWARPLLAVELGLYITICLAAGILEAVRGSDWALAPGVVFALWTSHFAWGIAFFWGLFTAVAEREERGSRQ
jgi:glycosyltransferase involved in cell wall biosynthesis